MEYELLDTGVFNDDRYFDVFVEYAKGAAEDILVRITAVNRGPDAADLHLLPTLWFRNDWSKWIAESNRAAEKPTPQADRGAGGRDRGRGGASPAGCIRPFVRRRRAAALHRERNEPRAAVPRQKNESPYVKDGINDCVVQGRQDAVNPGKQGTKVAAHYTGQYRRRSDHGDSPAALQGSLLDQKGQPFGKPFDDVFADRLREADEFYKSVTPPSVSADAANVMRQALAGMLWSKQFFFFDGDNWLDEHHSNPAPFRISRRPELGVVPHAERGHHLDARQVGVPLVRGLGPGLPHAPALDRRSRLRQGADEPDAPRLLPAPERSDARLRVELQRREPAGPRLCDPVPPSHRAGAAWRSGPGLPQVDLQQAPAELHLVGQPQGPLRQERVRGRLPRPRQHRRVRPQRPAADRRPPRTGGRHGVDGALQPEHAGARGGARRARPHLRGHGLQVRRALLLHRRGDEPARAGRHVGRGGRLLLRPAAAPRRQRHAAQGALDGGAPPAVRHHGDREVAAGARPAGDGCTSRNGCAGCPNCRRRCTRRARGISAWPSAGSWPWSTRSGSAGS